MEVKKEKKIEKNSLFGLLGPYRGFILLLVGLAFFSNGLALWVPRIVSRAIDAFGLGQRDFGAMILEFILATVFIMIFSYLLNITQTVLSERVARDLRLRLSARIARHSHRSIQEFTTGKLLSILSSDVDAIKNFAGMAVSSIISSVLTIIGGSVLLLLIDWRLGLTVLAIIPVIGLIFFFIMSRVRVLFLRTRLIIDRLNQVINESILGAALIRVFNSQTTEKEKFQTVNTDARETGLKILNLFASMIPAVSFTANLATLAILALGGHFVISESLSLGDFVAFNSYVVILVFPIIMLGFISNFIAQAQISFARIKEVLDKDTESEEGSIKKMLTGSIEVRQLSLFYEKKPILKNLNFRILPGSRTAIVGPTAAGKTQLLYQLIGLSRPSAGEILYDGISAKELDQEDLHKQVGLVFQDSIIFNMSLRENIAFSSGVSEENLAKAIQTAELDDFVASLDSGLETVVSERGSSLSGGQKQRLMLARALAICPRILLLDDFTARVDNQTEKAIIENLRKNYPDLTLVSVTQKIINARDYDDIIVLMEGEIVAQGRHEELMKTSPEYIQIYESQQSTNED
jgi:ATP-binding cassette subfamily B protein